MNLEEQQHQSGDDWQPSESVVLAVAEAAGVDPTALRPLHDVVDPDALDSLFRDNSALDTGRLTFDYEGHRVSVRQDGRVFVDGRLAQA